MNGYRSLNLSKEKLELHMNVQYISAMRLYMMVLCVIKVGKFVCSRKVYFLQEHFSDSKDRAFVSNLI